MGASHAMMLFMACSVASTNAEATRATLLFIKNHALAIVLRATMVDDPFTTSCLFIIDHSVPF
eukprot:scaffold9825_cov203-Cylindrotheca_fusiformis.AAC.5